MSTPSAFLQNLLGRPVVVKLNSGVDYRGVLVCLDGYMNIALEQVGINGNYKREYCDREIHRLWAVI
jgi:U6 snRNA-associated Sm-like protein LSm6